MIDPRYHPLWLRLMTLVSLARSFLVGRATLVRKTKLNRSQFYNQTWRAAAGQLGAQVEEHCAGVLEITRGNQRTLVRANYTPLDDPVTLFMAGNKPFVLRRLRQCGLQTPQFLEFSFCSVAGAIGFLKKTEAPCVVKPAHGTGAGQGITTGIRTRSQLVRAIATAARFGNDLLIEEQIPGDNFRLLYLDGVLLDAVKRQPPTVIGDGTSSIRTLVRRENTRRGLCWQAAQVVIHVDRELKQTLAKQALSLRSIPGRGQRVVLKTVVNDNAADDNEPALNSLCDDLIEVGAQAAHVLGVRLAGVDIITTDPGRPLVETDGVVLEVNTTPGLYHHKRGDHCPVAASLLEAMLQHKHQSLSTSGGRGFRRAAQAGEASGSAVTSTSRNRVCNEGGIHFPLVATTF